MDIPDGFHTGAITAVEVVERKGFRYMDLLLTVADVSDQTGKLAEIKVGYPLNEQGACSPNTLAGLLFTRFGVGVVVGSNVNEQALINRLCQYVTVKVQKLPGKQYVEVNRDSLKPFNPATIKIQGV